MRRAFVSLGGSLSSKRSLRPGDADLRRLWLPRCMRYLSRVAARDEHGILPRLSPSECLVNFVYASSHPSRVVFSRSRAASVSCASSRFASGPTVEGVALRQASVIQARWLPPLVEDKRYSTCCRTMLGYGGWSSELPVPPVDNLFAFGGGS